MEKTIRSRFAAIQPPWTLESRRLFCYVHFTPVPESPQPPGGKLLLLSTPELALHLHCRHYAQTPVLRFPARGYLLDCPCCQDSGAQKRFAGLWEAKLKDKVICAIKLEAAANNISGAVLACQIHVNGDGELIEQESSEPSDDKPEPILDPKIQGDTLSFAVKDEDDEQPLKFKLKLTCDTQAELRILNAPAPVKPIHFEKK